MPHLVTIRGLLAVQHVQTTLLALAALAAPFAPAGSQENPSGVPPAAPAFIEAQRAEVRKDFSRAESLYDMAVRQDPDYTAALEGRARMRSWLGRFTEAIEDYEQVLAHDPDNPQALSGLAWTHAWNGNYDRARSLFEYLARAEPYYLDAPKGLAYVDLWRGNAREARRQFEALAAEDQGNPDYVLAIAQAAYMEGDLRAARAAYRDALELKPDLEAARTGLEAVEKASLERRPELTVLGGRSESGDISNSGIRMAQISMQVRRNLRLWINHDRGVGFDGFSADRRERDAATTTLGAFFNYRPRMAARIEAGVRDLVDETQPVFSAEQVFFLPGGTTPKVGVWLADSDEQGTQWVVNAGVHRWLGPRFAIEPTLYVGDDGQSEEIRGALLATYTVPRRFQVGLGVAVGDKDTPQGSRSVDRLFGNLSIPLGERATLLFYGWREGTEGFEDQTVLAAGLSVHL